MTYHYKSTGLASVAALAVGALIAFAELCRKMGDGV